MLNTSDVSTLAAATDGRRHTVTLEPRMYAPLAELIDVAGRLTKNDESVPAIITRVEGEAGSLWDGSPRRTPRHRRRR